jgi:hypothetical protein
MGEIGVGKICWLLIEALGRGIVILGMAMNGGRTLRDRLRLSIEGI